MKTLTGGKRYDKRINEIGNHNLSGIHRRCAGRVRLGLYAFRGLTMCYGVILFDGSPCPYEIQGGENWGECRKPRGNICPNELEGELEEEEEI